MFHVHVHLSLIELLVWQLAQTTVLHNNMLMGGRVHSRDRFSNWRLDIDDMSYEQLLELGDKIGYVNTGLKEDEISRCIRKTKGSMKKDIATNVPVHVDNKCSICQEEYEADEEMGKLCCGHSFHIPCIKQWLLQKNACPVCKTEAKTSMLASMDSSY
ncbi:putative Catalytic [Hibiscus syriacus]|uniref:RING-type E3 ubiquitin transferase n=1 Tax=Hibiscus syriacus TaxID=106335 RepID=A0A6A2XYV2_HIBSY|nr:E3 ubiquitin-protein ligase MBR1-like [Hibiscus syriacus]KAE8667756.1 putative Catalytic [Hibiscus syriacus]